MGVKVGRYPNAGGTSMVRRMDFAAGTAVQGAMECWPPWPHLVVRARVGSNGGGV
jgi:hypothetical protein